MGDAKDEFRLSDHTLLSSTLWQSLKVCASEIPRPFNKYLLALGAVAIGYRPKRQRMNQREL